MKLLGFLEPETIIASLSAHTAEEVVRELVEAVVAAGGIAEGDKGQVIEAVLDRERQGSTGIGGGIALPHALSDDLDQLYMVFARTTAPIDFEALDSQPVDLIFMLVGPKASGNMYVKLLARVSRLLQSEDFKNRLREAATPDAVLEVFRHEE